jgi:hypothetical protein
MAEASDESSGMAWTFWRTVFDGETSERSTVISDVREGRSSWAWATPRGPAMSKTATRRRAPRRGAR